MSSPRRYIATALLAAFVALVAACGSGGEQRYSDEVREEYLSSCASGGSGEAYCRCTLAAFESRYTFAELEELVDAVDRSERLDEFLAIIAECS